MPSTLFDQGIRDADDSIKNHPPMQYVDNNRTRAVITPHSNYIYLPGDMFIGSVLPPPLAGCGNPGLSSVLGPGLVRIFHLAVFLTSSSSLTPGYVLCSRPAIFLALSSPSLLVRRESERVGSSGLAGALFGRVGVGLSTADIGIEG